MNRVSEYMIGLGKKLMEERGVAEPTANLYLRNLWTLNGKKPFKTLAFLRNTTNMEEMMKDYADTTKKSMLTAMVSALSLMKDKPAYKKTHQHYSDLLNSKAEEMAEVDTAEKTEKQSENWVSWEEVLAIKENLKAKAEALPAKGITAKQYGDLLGYVILSLYTDIPPRRNQDYSECYVVGRWNEEMPKDRNYYCVATKRFIFNKYKTAKSHGTQIIDISSSPLVGVISKYLKYHPLNSGKMTNGKTFRFLVSEDGSPLSAVNAITRVLNRVLGKKVGSSMLRHIYLSSKYDIEAIKADADAMAHSVPQQISYLKAEST